MLTFASKCHRDGEQMLIPIATYNFVDNLKRFIFGSNGSYFIYECQTS